MKIIIFLNFILAFLLFTNQGLAADRFVIGKLDLKLDITRLDPAMVRSLIPIQVGDTVTEETLEDLKRQLALTGLFKVAEIAWQQSHNSVSVKITLADAPLIRRINVSGNYPFLSKKITRLSAVQPGDPYDDLLSEDSRTRIKQFLAKNGYSEANVAIIPDFEKTPGFVHLQIKITKGLRRKIGQIAVSGNTFFSSKYIKNTVRGFGPFTPNKLRRKLKNIQNSYVDKGFVRARVRLNSAHVNSATKRVDLDIGIVERKRLILSFSGNHWFKPQTLADQVRFFQERGYSAFTIDRSVQQLLAFYQINGFVNAHIEPLIEKTEQTIVIKFIIEEGPRVRLKKIVFDGNHEISKGKLLRFFESDEHSLTGQGFYRDELIRRDLSQLIPHYHRLGFLDAQLLGWEIIDNKYGDKKTLLIHLDEGEPYLIAKISADNLLDLDKLKSGKRFTEEKLERTQQKLRRHFQAEGYPHADVRIKHLKNPETRTVDLLAQVKLGPKVLVRNIVIQGQHTTKTAAILEAFSVKSGDPYIYSRVLTGQLNLKRLGVFDQVRVSSVGLEQKNEAVDIVIHVQEHKPITIDAQAGFDSDKLGSGQLLITKRNLFGWGKHVQWRGVGGFELSRGEMTFSSPRAFGASWNLVNQYFVQYEDDEHFNATSYGGSIGALKNYGPDWSLLLKTEVSRFNIFESESNQAILANNLFDSSFMEYLVSGNYDTRDNYADPNRGLNVLGSTEFDIDLASAANTFNISRLNAALYLGFAKRFTFVNTARAAKLFRINPNANIPVQKLFFMGGNDTIRGFDEDAVSNRGGLTSLLYNAELQFRLFESFKLATFFDAGSLTDTFNQISRNTFREAVGLGLRYITPVGPIRMDYGFVLDKRAGEDGQRFHFAFGYYF